MATTVSAKIYEHHEKSDGTFNVKYVVYHNGERKFIDSPHCVSKRQITKGFDIKDKIALKWLVETLDDYRVLISAVGSSTASVKCISYFIISLNFLKSDSQRVNEIRYFRLNLPVNYS
jgi:hypothetical protein